MAHEMVRQPSQTPNIDNIDDIIPFRYAYGNQDGYVINKGNELSHTINGSEFRINSGRVVLQGVEDDIDANGVSFSIENIAETRYYVIYYRVNLALNLTSYEIDYDTAGYPTIDAGDDLTKNSSGSANLPLYRFTALSGVISGVEKVVNAIEYSGTALVGYDIEKGTVEERLTRLGFKEGSVIIDNVDYSTTTNFIHKQGYYVLGRVQFSGRIPINVGENPSYTLIGTIPEEFIGKGIKTQSVSADVNVSINYDGSVNSIISYEGFINLFGKIYLRATTNKQSGIYSGTTTADVNGISFSYEIESIE